MDARVDAAPRAGAGRALHAVVMPMATFVLATSPHAQASPCDDYKAVLEARFEAAGVRGYSLEVTPASAPVPPGAKVIADCEGGARKFVYRRWGGAAASPSVAASAVRAASAMPARANEAATVRPTERVADSTVVVTPAAVAPVQPAASAAATAGQRATAFATAHWPWLGGLAALVGGLWLWRTRFSGYDKDGLPRGPRL